MLIQLRNTAIGITISILTLFVVMYGVNTFYPNPEYSDFCGEVRTAEIIENANQCEEVGGNWIVYEKSSPDLITSGWCDRDYICRQEYDQARETHYRNVFIIALPTGLFIIIFGATIFGLESVGVGLMLGGIFSIIYGAGGYWHYAENWIRFLLSLIGLVILIWFAYWFNGRSGKKDKESKKKKTKRKK